MLKLKWLMFSIANPVRKQIKDTKKPIIESVFIYKLNDPLNIEKENMTNQKVITGQFSFGIKTYDLLDLAENKNGINNL